MIGKVATKQEIEKVIADLKREGYTKEQSIELQEDVCKTTFNDACHADEQYKKTLFSKASHKEKEEARLYLNQALKEHIKQTQILNAIKESWNCYE